MKKNDDEIIEILARQNQRLIRAIVISSLFGLLLSMGIVLFFSYQNRELKRLINLKQTSTIVKSITGPEGLPGLNGLSVIGPTGATGLAGASGVNGLSIQGSTGPQGEKGDQGLPGEPGESGSPGKAVLVRQNPKTGDVECKYGEKSTNWFPVSECQ